MHNLGTPCSRRSRRGAPFPPLGDDGVRGVPWRFCTPFPDQYLLTSYTPMLCKLFEDHEENRTETVDLYLRFVNDSCMIVTYN